MLATLMGITCWKDYDKADLRILSDPLRHREELARVTHTQDGRIHLLDVIERMNLGRDLGSTT